jgi:hypothetical protein
MLAGMMMQICNHGCTFVSMSLTPAWGNLMQQRAFLLARKREREARMVGRHGGSLSRRSPGGAYNDRHGDDDRYGDYEDESDDSFIEDDIGDDWRTALRQMTGALCSRLSCCVA